VRVAAEAGRLVDVLVIDLAATPRGLLHPPPACEVTDMNCPSAIAEVLLEILHCGILRARAAGWAGDADRAAIEADHVHNLPDQLRNYSPEQLRYYWDAERPSFMAHLSTDELAWWEPLWQRLRSQAEVEEEPLRSA
jgi:hypothetical protein